MSVPPPEPAKRGDVQVGKDGNSAWRWTGTNWVQLRWTTGETGLVFLVGIVIGIVSTVIYFRGHL